MTQPAIVWFRRNLRLADNAALLAARETGRPVICVYIGDDTDNGSASRWWLHHSLERLAKNLETTGNRLIVRRANPVEELGLLVDTSGAAELFYSRRYESSARAQEGLIERSLASRIDIRAFDDEVLVAPPRVKTTSGGAYKVFTPFWRAASAEAGPQLPQAAPGRLPSFADPIDSLTVDDLDLRPAGYDWTGGLAAAWTPGEDGALEQLRRAAADAPDYEEVRDRPDLDRTSRLSPHLHFGEIGPRQVWHTLQSAALGERSSRGVEALIRQLYWREYSRYLLYHSPSLPNVPLRQEFEHFPWIEDAALFDAWRRGRTGYPIVDAGMRQLWQSGWMHNRVRMIAASFLVKNLLVPWQRGAEWFLDTLVDADLANNSAGWQWVAGCGTDAAPYIRIFNPVLQGRKFDPHGRYVRRWLPELGELSEDHIHAPWQADGLALELAGVRLGADYPLPVVELKASRERALAAYREFRGLLQSAAKSPGSSAG